MADTLCLNLLRHITGQQNAQLSVHAEYSCGLQIIDKDFTCFTGLCQQVLHKGNQPFTYLEGKLGVEGLPVEILREAILRAGVSCGEEPRAVSLHPITKLDLFEAGLTGRDDSAARRRRFLASVGLPEHLSANSMVPVLNSMMTYEEFMERCRGL